MNRPRLLDLFCGVGGCSVGYHRAGFEVVGVDIAPQPRYPFPFHQGDAMTFPLDGFDVIHASPPCQAYSITRHRHPGRHHDDLYERVRDRLVASCLPWVIENVPGAPYRQGAILCGSAFGLKVRRHRNFESSVLLFAPVCRHHEQGQPLGVYGNSGDWTRTAPGGGGRKVSGPRAAAALGITHTTLQRELSQAIPPAYTEWVGRQLIDALRQAA